MPWKYIGRRRPGEKPGDRRVGGIPAQDLSDEDAAPYLSRLQESPDFEPAETPKPKRAAGSED